MSPGERNRTDPDTPEHRNLRALRDWRYKMRTGFRAVDPLQPAERAWCESYYRLQRARVRRWMRDQLGLRFDTRPTLRVVK